MGERCSRGEDLNEEGRMLWAGVVRDHGCGWEVDVRDGEGAVEVHGGVAGIQDGRVAGGGEQKHEVQEAGELL